LKELSVDERDFTEMIREMGFRLKDIAAITPADVIFESRAIDMRRIRSKRGHKRPLPLSPRAWSILSRRARGKGKTARLFPFTRSHVRHAFQRACARLGIRDLWLYDLKSTFVTEKFREGWPEKIIQEFTGNKTPGTFRRYQRPTDDDLRRFIGAKRRRSGNKRRGRLQETPVTY
ncbi:MAG TPA: tyrosine-type recombinase/integrase, partial [Candidatus Binatia bacterium]